MPLFDFSWGQPEPERFVRKGSFASRIINLKACAAEFVAMTIFIVIGCGTAANFGAKSDASRLTIALAFGLAITVLVYSFGHHSGAQINCAVTFSLVLGGRLPWYQGIANAMAQLLGSFTGAALLGGMVSCTMDQTGNLGSNVIDPAHEWWGVLVAEAIGTFLLCFVVYETALSTLSSAGANAALAIGLAVFLAHLLLIPMDGCSINPSRSFGPALVSDIKNCNGDQDRVSPQWQEMHIMWFGPLLGATMAALVQRVFVPRPKKSALEDPFGNELAKGIESGHLDVVASSGLQAANEDAGDRPAPQAEVFAIGAIREP